MHTIYLVGHATHSPLAQAFERDGFFVLRAESADAALAMLGAVCADCFVIDVRNAAVGGERLIDRLQRADPWRRLPIVVTGARPAQYKRLSQQVAAGEVIPACEFSTEAVLAAVHRLLRWKADATPFDDVPGRHAWSRRDVSPMRMCRRTTTTTSTTTDDAAANHDVGDHLAPRSLEGA